MVAKMVISAVETRVKRGDWNAIEYVLMPNHLHMFLELRKGTLFSQMVSFKRWTTRHGRQILGLGAKAFWQREWFDHWPRSEQEDLRIAKYIRDNPIKGGLVKNYQDWPYGSWRQQ